MESKNYYLVNNFISTEEINDIREWVNSKTTEDGLSNVHIDLLVSKLNGISIVYDISKTEITNKISNFQSSLIGSDEIPDLLMCIIDRISKKIRIPKENMFLQVIDMDNGGKVYPHYDMALSGYINFKCNISVLSENYEINIGDQNVKVKEGDLYCFEASLYKHWTSEFNSRRILLSFGFMLPYSVLGRDPEDPRARMSRRIEKYIQHK